MTTDFFVSGTTLRKFEPAPGELFAAAITPIHRPMFLPDGVTEYATAFPEALILAKGGLTNGHDPSHNTGQFYELTPGMTVEGLRHGYTFVRDAQRGVTLDAGLVMTAQRIAPICAIGQVEQTGLCEVYPWLGAIPATNWLIVDLAPASMVRPVTDRFMRTMFQVPKNVGYTNL